MSRTTVRHLLIAGIAALGLLAPASAQAITYAPVDQPGPALSVPAPQLNDALQCPGNLAGGPPPVLLVHGTGSSPSENFSWNWERALNALGIPWCTVALLGRGMDDVQVSGEYVVNAIRTMYVAAGNRRISIIGHSQGGMIPRWALRFWPDTRSMVDDVIGLAPSNHGTYTSVPTCLSGCAPSFWQQTVGSNFVNALNSYKETFAGISYTVVYTRTDWVVTPNTDSNGSSSLRTGDGQISNTAIQEVCPGDANEHLQVGTVDAVAYALAKDALTHPGPADASRIPAAVCAQPFMPGVNPATVAADEGAAAAGLANTIATYPRVPAEPPLKCYVTGTCETGKPTCRAASKNKKKRKHRAVESKKKKQKKHGCAKMKKRRRKHH